MSNLESQLRSDVSAILGEDGHASRLLKRFRFQPQQLDYAHRTASGLCREDTEFGRASLTMLQAATGTGKTLGYLVPLMLYAARTGQRVAVSTYTRHLQRQIVNKDAPDAARLVAALTGVNLSFASRVGRTNYIDAAGCQRMAVMLRKEDAKRYSADLDLLDEMIDWCDDNNASGILEDFLNDRSLDGLPAGIIRGVITLNTYSANENASHYERDVRASKAVDFLIVNHALSVMHAYRWGSVLNDPDERAIRVMVFDEADRLSDAASSILAADLPLHKLMTLCDKASERLGLPAIKEAASGLYARSLSQPVPESRSAMATNADEIGRHLRSTAAAMSKASHLILGAHLLDNQEGEHHDLAREFLDSANDVLRLADSLDTDRSGLMISWSPVREYPSLYVGNPDAGRIMSRLWREKEPSVDEDTTYPTDVALHAALFTSATLATPGRRFPEAFDEFSREIGVIRHPRKGEDEPIHWVHTDLMQTYQPAKFGHLRFVLADPCAPLPSTTDTGSDEVIVTTDPLWLDYCATMIRAAHKNGGRTLALTLSWRDTLALGDRLKDIASLRVQKRGEPLARLLSQYTSDALPDAVLLSPGAWEGVDLPEKVNNLVVTRIPFLPPIRQESSRHRLALMAQGKDSNAASAILAGHDLSAMRRKLEQGIGRALRAPSDKATVWIADPRFPLPESFADSLDVVILKAPARKSYPSLRSCIPRRFLNSTYPKAQLLLTDGTLHTIGDA